jgi:hypothetical protein
VATSVVFVVLGIAGAGLAVVLYRTMLSGVDSAAAGRISEIADAVQTAGAAGVEPALLQTDQRIVAVQVIRADGSVVRRSASAPDVPLLPLAGVSGGPHIGMPEQTSPFGRIRFSALTVDGPDGRYTILVGEAARRSRPRCGPWSSCWQWPRRSSSPCPAPPPTFWFGAR